MLKCVTLTGADDSVQPGELFDVSKKFPFVEWGILFSRNQRGKPRFPSADWLDVLGTDYHLLADTKAPANFSLHLCGGYVREFCKGFDDFASDLGDDLFQVFKRIQINTHGVKHDWDVDEVAKLIGRYPEKEYIFQLDGSGENEAMAKSLVLLHHLKNVSFLYDISHGAGLTPDHWPLPHLAGPNFGYAGGLGVDNIKERMHKFQYNVNAATHFEGNWWVDMETKVRTIDLDLNDKFSLPECEKVLTITQAWVTEPSSVGQ